MLIIFVYLMMVQIDYRKYDGEKFYGYGYRKTARDGRNG